MLELETKRVERRPREIPKQTKRSLRGAVVAIAHEGMTLLAQVHPNLVRSSGEDADLEEGATGKPLESFPLAHRLSRRPCPARDLRAVKDVAADWAIDRQPLGGRPVRESQIDFRDRSLLELSLEGPMGAIVLRYHHPPRSSGVEPMDDPRSHHAPYPAQIGGV